MSMTFDAVIETDTGVQFPVPDLGLNVSTSNGWKLQILLGLEPDYSGTIEPADLLGRLLLAEAGARPERVVVGDPASRGLVAALGAGGAQMHDCSRPLDEYLDARLPVLRDLAEAALAAGARIQWC